MPVAYNPNDPLQQSFLAALAQGESGGMSHPETVGYGGIDLSGLPTDQYGFPEWAGLGNSHAAGTYQFQPGTWDNLAAEFGLNFQHDQSEGAWLYAQQQDPTLYDDLRNKNFAKIQSALAGVWPSVTGNGAAPAGLANDLAATVPIGTSDPLANGIQGLTGWTLDNDPLAWIFGQSPDHASSNFSAPDAGVKSVTGPATADAPAGTKTGELLSGVSGLFTQGALIVIGAVIVLVALWVLLSRQGVVPSPRQVAHIGA